LRGASANTVTSATRTEFYFFFDKSLSNPGYAKAGLSTSRASSPAELTIVKMERKGDTREAVLGEIMPTLAQRGGARQDIIEFSFEKIRLGVLRSYHVLIYNMESIAFISRGRRRTGVCGQKDI
jgi:hypothetical protein